MNKERERFWELVEPHYAEAMAFCRKLAGERDLGDDLFQDALVLALTRFSDLKAEAAFRSWLYRIIVRSHVSMRRRPWWKRRVRLTPESELTILKADPSDRHTARRWLRRAFEAVSPEDQALLTLYELEDWTIAEIAELYGKSEGSIKLRLFRIRRKMKKRLQVYLHRAERLRETEDETEGAPECAAMRPNPD